MKLNQLQLIQVSLIQNQASNKIPVGKLAFKNQKSFFEYDASFLKSDLQLSPFKLPLQSGLISCHDNTFAGLFGVFNDSLPDGWGLLLMDRKLKNLGFNKENLSPLNYLSLVGTRGMGALIYEPEFESEKIVNKKTLDEISAEILNVIESDDEKNIDELLCRNGSSAGARPKIVVKTKNNDWLIKFRSSMDFKDIGPLELAYYMMAQKSGLKMMTSKLFHSEKNPGYFGTKRFDRDKNGKRIHVHSMSGLLHVDHRLPSLDYEAILKTTLWLTKDMRQVETQFRNMVFNVFAHNRDDHAKNFSFLMSEDGTWTVSPAYDLTFSYGPGGEHCTALLGEGKKPTCIHLKKLGAVIGINPKKVNTIIEEVYEAVTLWPHFALDAGVSKKTSQLIQKILERVKKD